MRSGKIHPALIGIAVLVFAGAIGVVVWLTSGSSISGLDPFPVSRYAEAPLQLRGNDYMMDVIIDEKLEWQDGVGQVIVVKPVQSSQSSIVVFINSSFQDNLTPGQRYRLHVKVLDGGTLDVRALNKF